MNDLFANLKDICGWKVEEVEYGDDFISIYLYKRDQRVVFRVPNDSEVVDFTWNP